MNGHRARRLRIAIGTLTLMVLLIGTWIAMRQHAHRGYNRRNAVGAERIPWQTIRSIF